MLCIEFKKLIYSILNDMVKEIEKTVDSEELKKLQSKYQASTTAELIEILICKASSNDISLNYKEFIDDLNQELSTLYFDNEILTNENDKLTIKNRNLEFATKRLAEEFHKLKSLVDDYKANLVKLEELLNRLVIEKKIQPISFKDYGL